MLLTSQQVQRLINELQTLYAALFCVGVLELAMGELEAASHSGEGAITFEMLKLGFRLGLAAALALWFMWDCMLQVGGSKNETCVPLVLTLDDDFSNDHPSRKLSFSVLFFLLLLRLELVFLTCHFFP